MSVDIDGVITPIRLWNVLLLPLQGMITDAQADAMSELVLGEVQRFGPRGLVVDLSGVALLDSHLCAIVAHLTHAAQLMGTPSFVAGVSPAVAMTLEAMGITFEHLTPVSSVEQAFARLGVYQAQTDARPDVDVDASADLLARGVVDLHDLAGVARPRP